MARHFEIPFNFDSRFLEWLITDGKAYLNQISFLYMPPYKEDYTAVTRTTELRYYPTNRGEYENQIHTLRNNGYNVAILLQGRHLDAKDELLSYFHDCLGIRHFVITDDMLARRVKALGDDVETLASITRKTSMSEIRKSDLSMYDKINLFYPFMASLSSCRNLPRDKTFVLLVNSRCDYTCDFMRHWFSHDPQHYREYCPNIRNGGKNITLIPPELLRFFDEFAFEYKLQGRDYLTTDIIDLINAYLGFDDSKSTLSDEICQDIKENYFERATRDQEIYERYLAIETKRSRTAPDAACLGINGAASAYRNPLP